MAIVTRRSGMPLSVAEPWCIRLQKRRSGAAPFAVPDQITAGRPPLTSGRPVAHAQAQAIGANDCNHGRTGEDMAADEHGTDPGGPVGSPWPPRSPRGDIVSDGH